MIKCLLKSLGQILCAEVPQDLSSNQGFFNILTWEAVVTSLYTFPSSQRHFPHPKSFEQRTEMMTFDINDDIRHYEQTLLVW